MPYTYGHLDSFVRLPLQKNLLRFIETRLDDLLIIKINFPDISTQPWQQWLQ